MKRTVCRLIICIVTIPLCSFADKWDSACQIPYETEPARQGLDAKTQVYWWFTGQGSQIMPYEWFLHLEQTGSKTLFKHPENLRSYGYIYASNDNKEVIEWNPDRLPIGFTKSRDPYSGVDWLGPSCAACHTSKITISGKDRLIDGAPSQADFWRFNVDVTAALQATLTTEKKFQDFARQVTNDSINELRDRLADVVFKRQQFNDRNAHEFEYGNARVDAFGIIFNQVVSNAMGMPENRREPDAPVSYPFLWGAHQLDLVQWNGVGDNTLPYVGPLARNAGEVMGVYGNIEIDEQAKTVRTSVLWDNLNVLENAMRQLRSPLWPQDQAIDYDRCRKGKEVFEHNCDHCHVYVSHKDQLVNYRNPSTDTLNRATMVPYWEVGTDHKMAVNAYRYTQTGFFEGDPILGNFGPAMRAWEHSFDIVGHVVILSLNEYGWKLVNQLMMPSNIKQFLSHTVNRGLLIKSPELHYKARPLNGIWATAPFLHNGSVPNLEQMLLIEGRVDNFCVGSTEFDPIRVGFKSDYSSSECVANGWSWFDTKQPGNGNGGHWKTKNLSTSQKKELLEFLKTL